MIVLMMILGVALVAASVWFLVRAGAVPRLHMESHLAQIDGYGAERVYGEVEGDAVTGTAPGRPFARLAARLGRFASQSIPSLPRLERKELNAAGIYSTEPEVVDGYRLLAGGVAAVVALLYGTVLTGGVSLLVAVLALAGAILGWELPALVIRRRGANRLAEIDKHLPDLIDLLVASVEAGLGVGASMALLGDRFEGPLGQELQLVLHQQRLGVSTAVAMNALGERADTPGVRAFARTLVRAEAMGGSVGAVLRNLAADARRRRRQQANERAAKVPLKLLFPLILLIFPALFVVLLYPAAYTIIRTFGG
jgi:tight adherence protein C